MVDKINLNKDSDILKYIVRKFYSSSYNFDLEPRHIEEITWNKQEEFLNVTINSHLIKKYPVNRNFIILFLKKIINYLENNQEVHDGIYSTLCQAMKNKNDDSFCYRHYIIGNDSTNIVTIKETNNIVVNGTTGMRTWEAAKILSDWAICNANVFKRKRILELGSGVGFTGITIAKFCEPECIFLSDCHEDVLSAIKDNIGINFPTWHQQKDSENVSFTNADQQIDVIALDWNEVDDLTIKMCPDVVIGADIVYDPTIIEPLCNVIKKFIKNNVNLEIYIAGIIRNKETFNQFLKFLDSSNLQYLKIQHSENVYLEWDNAIERYLLKINST